MERNPDAVCATCAYKFADSNGFLRCRFDPPTVVPQTGGNAISPIVRPTDWCGRHHEFASKGKKR